MVQFRVRAESLSEVAGHLGSVIATFDGNLAAVESQVSGVLPTWKGDDQESFQENWKTFVAMADAVRMSLVALQGGLLAASGSYDATEAGVGRTMNQARPGTVAIRKYNAAYEKIIAAGEQRAEDMAEFFGRDYAGDREKEQFGGGAVRGRNGRWTGGGSEDTDGDGDSDGIGTGPYLSQASVDELNGVPGADGGEPDGDKGDGKDDGDRDGRDRDDRDGDDDRVRGERVRLEADFVAFEGRTDG
ncbi:WXG100 family type VII secretion target [Microbacterium paludicola]|uniref:WXG100 family type VII secretion target n=1 Tax=Microbacterium paludicola TaxID=300019 RepID=A0A4Y9FVL5_9MICO|nr:WXG100 family type VII secretion target [Microbacterium paludicola]MBF0817014.1 WXG100 family type VII secretion target [Microbacterium paludicola]TFU32268.1 WXG100 family type VII secretion target [Microbacterium paludicola]